MENCQKKIGINIKLQSFAIVVDSYEEALKKCRKAEYKSNLETEASEKEKKSRKNRKRKLSSDSEEEEYLESLPYPPQIQNSCILEEESQSLLDPPIEILLPNSTVPASSIVQRHNISKKSTRNAQSLPCSQSNMTQRQVLFDEAIGWNMSSTPCNRQPLLNEIPLARNMSSSVSHPAFSVTNVTQKQTSNDEALNGSSSLSLQTFSQNMLVAPTSAEQMILKMLIEIQETQHKVFF